MYRKVVVFSVLIILFSSCVHALKYTWTKENYEGKKFDNILVLAIGQNTEAHTVFENIIIKTLLQSGVLKK